MEFPQDIDLTSFDDAQKKALGLLLETATKGVREEIEAVKAENAALKTELAAVRDEAKKAAPRKDDPPKNDPAQGDPTNDDSGKGVAGMSETEALVRNLTERLDAMESDKKTAAEREAAERVARGFVEKKYPNLQGKGRLIQRIAAGAPKDEAAAETLAGEVFEEWAEAGGTTVERLTADPEGEGAKKTPEESKEAKLEELRGMRGQAASTL